MKNVEDRARKTNLSLSLSIKTFTKKGKLLTHKRICTLNKTKRSTLELSKEDREFIIQSKINLY